MATVRDLQSEEAMKPLLKTSGVCLLNFWASWAEPCKQIKEVIDELAKDTNLSSGVHFVHIEAEKFPEVCMKFNVIAVPTCVLVKQGKEVDRVNGVYPSEIAKKVRQHSSVPSVDAVVEPRAMTKEELNKRLESLIKSSPVMLFMKGSPENVRCGFSRKMIEILKSQNVRFGSFDILSDEAVRQGLKEYSNWPTFPQLYAKGDLIGGLDIVKEMVEGNEFLSALPSECVVPPIEERLKTLINMKDVMLFMKGDPSEPRCGFSRQMVAILNETGVPYGHFNILADEEVRQGLKQFSNWPTYPQLYVKGDLIGGLDIVKEMVESGELKSALTGSAQ